MLIGANSSGGQELDLEGEFVAISTAINEEGRGRYWVVSVLDVDGGRVQELLDKHQPVLVHFSGHGTKEGDFVMRDSSGAPQPAGMGSLAYFLGQVPSLRCVVFSCCYSAEQQHVMNDVASCVAFDSEILERSATTLSVAFYRQIARGSSVRVAYCHGYHNRGIVQDIARYRLRLYERGQPIWTQPPRSVQVSPQDAAGERAQQLLAEHFKSSETQLQPLLEEIASLGYRDVVVGFFNAMKALRERGGLHRRETAEQLMTYFRELVCAAASRRYRLDSPGVRSSLPVAHAHTIEPVMAARARRDIEFLPDPRGKGELIPRYHVEVNHLRLPEGGLDTEAHVRLAKADLLVRHRPQALVEALERTFVDTPFAPGSIDDTLERIAIAIELRGTPRYALLRSESRDLLDELERFLRDHIDGLELVTTSESYDKSDRRLERSLERAMIDFYNDYDHIVSPS